ncbi:hypothetical protein DWW90_01695 [Parabacteroides sp. AF17-28]|nr:hypothetical protein DWW90_01695 [Parabacteroides sp. AF17-28]
MINSVVFEITWFCAKNIKIKEGKYISTENFLDVSPLYYLCNFRCKLPKDEDVIFPPIELFVEIWYTSSINYNG